MRIRCDGIVVEQFSNTLLDMGDNNIKAIDDYITMPQGFEIAATSPQHLKESTFPNLTLNVTDSDWLMATDHEYRLIMFRSSEKLNRKENC